MITVRLGLQAPAVLLGGYFCFTPIPSAKTLYKVMQPQSANSQWTLDTSFGFPIRVAFTSDSALPGNYRSHVIFLLIEDSNCTPTHLRTVFTGMAARHQDAAFIEINVYSDPEMLRRAIERYRGYPDEAIFPDTPQGEALEKQLRGELYIPKNAWARARYYKTSSDGERFLYKPNPQKVEMLEVVLKTPPTPKYNGDLQVDLMLAASLGDFPKVMALIKSGAGVDYKDETGESALVYAVGHNKPDIVKFLLDCGADVDSKNRYGQTVLNEALSHGFQEVFRILLEHGADVTARYGPGISVLHLAAYKGDDDAVEALLTGGADPNAVDQDGNTPLFDAVRTRKATMVRALVQRGALIDVRNNRGETPISLAHQTGDQSLMDALKSHGLRNLL